MEMVKNGANSTQYLIKFCFFSS